MGKTELGDLETVIKHTQSTVLIFFPWNKPAVINCIWCLYEIMLCLTNKKRPDITMSLEQHKAFTKNIDSLPTLALILRKLDARKAEV
jgi:hypothetical protein